MNTKQKIAILVTAYIISLVYTSAKADELDWHDDPTWEGEGTHTEEHWSEVTPKLYNIIMCESHWNPEAQNPYSTAAGLGQLLDLHAPKFTAHGWNYTQDKYDYRKNLIIAKELYNRQGSTPWLSSYYCWSKMEQ